MVLLVVLLVAMYPMFERYSNNFDSYISRDEYDAFQWIRANTPANSYLLTDPGSGYVARGFTLRNASIYLALPDGRMPANASSLYPDLNALAFKFMSSSLLSDSVQNLLQIPFDPIYVVITSRTVQWAGSFPNEIFTHPVEGVNYTSVTSKFVFPYFSEVYGSNTVKIYQPNPMLTIRYAIVWREPNQTSTWSWYLDGAYRQYFWNSNSSQFEITAQAASSENAWTGLTTQLHDISHANYLSVRYAINLPVYELELVFWQSNVLTSVRYLKQSSVWITQNFTLTLQEHSATTIGIIMWTNDPFPHVFNMQYLFIEEAAVAVN